MNEYLKINWRVQHPSELEYLTTEFLTNDIVANSNIYKHFNHPLLPQKDKKCLKSVANKAPYIPGLKSFKKINRPSILTKLQKHHCFIAMQLVQSGKSLESMTTSEKYSMELYSKCQHNIVKENEMYLKYIKTIWEKSRRKRPGIRKNLLHYAEKHWKRNCTRSLEYPQFYKNINQLPLTFDENKVTINFECISNVLEIGTLARFITPILSEMLVLPVSSLPNENEAIFNSQLPVSSDQNVEKILENTAQVDVVISSSGIKTIIDSSDFQTNWILPVIIKYLDLKDNNGKLIKKKIIFIDKVLPKLTPKYHDFKYIAYKHLVKTNLCENEAFTYPTEDILIPNKTIKTSENEDEQNCSEKKVKRSRVGKIHHNVNYRIWKIQSCSNENELMKNNQKMCEIKLLVRCKLDGCEMSDQGVLLPCTVRPKVEQQIEYGANIPSKSELARDWSSLFFRPFSNLNRVRIDSKSSEVIAVEKCTIQQINSEAMKYYKYKPILGLGILQKILESLLNLETGSYLLQHLPKHGAFVSILKECNKSCKNAYDLHNDYSSCTPDATSHPDWLPIDMNYILPSHKENNLIPGIFAGFRQVKNNNKIQKKMKKKK